MSGSLERKMNSSCEVSISCLAAAKVEGKRGVGVSGRRKEG